MVSAGGSRAASHFFSVCWNLSTFPWVWGWLAREWSNRMPRRRARALSRATRPPRRGRPVKTAPLSVSTRAGIPQRRKASWKVRRTTGPVMVRRGTLARARREWSSRMLRISTSVPSARRQWVVSACHRSLGCSASNSAPRRAGSLLGPGCHEPASDQDPPDRRDRGHRELVLPGPGRAPGQVATDGVGTGVQTPPGQLLAQPNDLVLDRGRDRVRAGVWPSRSRLVRGLTLGEVALDQLLDPVARDVVVAGDLTLGATPREQPR